MPPRALLLSALLCLAAVPATSQGLLSLGSLDKGRHWDAVGRLEIGGQTFCTGALIEPGLVLTAAHCLYDPETGARVSVKDINFLAGWRNGRAAAYRRVRRATHHPDYQFRGEADTSRVRNDLALLELQHPIQNTTITPFETDRRPRAGDEIGVVSYARDRADAPSLQEMCEVITRQEGIVVMSCEVDFGASGSPVFSFESGTPRIVSVVSAKAQAEGDPVSLGVGLEGPLDLLKARLASETALPGTRSEKAGARGETDAKTVRP